MASSSHRGGAAPYRSREGLSTRSGTNADEIQLRIDPMHSDLDDHISGLHSLVRMLSNVAQEIESEAKYQNDAITQLGGSNSFWGGIARLPGRIPKEKIIQGLKKAEKFIADNYDVILDFINKLPQNKDEQKDAEQNDAATPPLIVSPPLPCRTRLCFSSSKGNTKFHWNFPLLLPELALFLELDLCIWLSSISNVYISL